MASSRLPASEPPFGLLLITDRRAVPAGRTLPEQLALALAIHGPKVGVLFRDKDLEPAARAELGRAVQSAVQGAGARLLVHGSLALARRLNAGGLHVDDSAAGRALLPKAPGGWVLGASCHDAMGLTQAATLGASYATLSPIFPSPGKAAPGDELGLAALAGPHPLPVFALGGIDGANGRDAITAGAKGLATIRAVLAARDPAAAVGSLLECL